MPRGATSGSSGRTTTVSSEVGTRAAVTEVLERFEDGRLNIVVEGRERFRLLELTQGRAFQTGLVEPVEDEPGAADPHDSEQAVELFHRLVELTGAEVEEPSLASDQLSFEASPAASSSRRR